ncbi:MAG: acetyl-CoA carboxylase biotin carboxylase subunit [Nitrospinae bacterium]|nr:acetyl-CoA carboxylase biotin carboxylase subunit [Nitrospinota bacterium]
MFKKILIANRGEIALRIIRACKELRIKTVAVHSKCDVNSLHVRFADETVCIGPVDSSRTYLNIPSIISAAEITGSDAIHPGYGFLAENPDFADICNKCGIKFIGPSAENIRLLGDKAKARDILRRVGIPVLPGSIEKVRRHEEAREIANEIGYPLMIKSSAGGGGRGIKIVRKEEDLKDSFIMAQSEAGTSFGNSQLYIEKYMERPKHIEIQILCDDWGNMVQLGERDCSIQRRYQKLLEESPAVIISPKLRKEIGDTAIRIAKEVGYNSVGTIEFLVCGDNYYFMEVNTRIQVEHPVTEMITGIDLIKEQIRISAGERLGLTQKDIRFWGHSIECRINAEDPDRFIPSPGRITALNLPSGPGIRVDTAIYCDYYILPYYDSLIAKLIVHGKDRGEALMKMKWALEEFHVEGIKTTIPFYKRLLRDNDFIKGEFYTDFLERYNKK